MEGKEEKGDNVRERNWEIVQIKAFTAWLNSYLESRGMKIQDLEHDLQDGTLLNHFIEIVAEKKIGKWDPAPSRKVQKLENLSIGLNYIQNVLNIRLVGIGSEDIFNCHLKLILGLVWSLFRGLRMTKLTAGAGKGKATTLEEGLLKWVREQTHDYEGVNISDFKYSFRDGLAFSALINKFDPSFLDYNSLDKSDNATNLKRAFEIAEKQMNIPQLLDANDLLEGDPDERSVQLYVSLFFHAFSVKKEKEEMEAAKKGITSKLEDLGTRLQREALEREELMKQKDELARGQQAMEEELSHKSKQVAELEKMKHSLQAELEELRLQVERLNELQKREKELQDKMEALEELVEQETEAKEEHLELAKTLREELEEKKRQVDQLRSKLDDGEEQKLHLSKELAEVRERLQAENERLKRQLKEETDLRHGRETMNARLKTENEKLKKRAETSGKLQAGWELLRRNLEEHLEDLYCWHEVQAEGETPDLKKRIDITAQFKPTSATHKDFASQLGALTQKLEEENKALLKILAVKDAVARRKEVVDKQGWLTKKGQRNHTWKKRWFVLRGDVLSYYKSDEDGAEAKGSISLSSCSVGPEKPEADARQWLLKIVVDGRKLVLDAETKKERDRWLSVLNGQIAFLAYKREAEDAETRPDLRLINFFTTDTVPTLHLDDRSLSMESVKAVSGLLSFHDELRVLSLENADLEDDEIKVISERLKKLDNVQVLRLGRNKLSNAAVISLAEALSVNRSLKELYLNDNEIGDEGLEALANSLKQHTNLGLLDLSGNKISDKGATALAVAIPDNHELDSLMLSRNSINDEGAAALASLIEHNPTICRVQLQGNNISDKGVTAISRALRANKSVTELDLSSNNIGNSGALEIRKLLDKNKVLEGVNLSGNKIQGGSDLARFLDTDSFFFPNLSFSRRIGK
jgi:cortexillin 1/2